MGRHPPATPPSTSESLPISIFLYITSKLLIIMGRYCEFAIRISLGRCNIGFTKIAGAFQRVLVLHPAWTRLWGGV